MKRKAGQNGAILCKDLYTDDIQIEILTGSTNKKKRDEILQRLKAGEIDVLVGTHALYSNGTYVCVEMYYVIISEELNVLTSIKCSSTFFYCLFQLFRCGILPVRSGR